MAGMTLKLTYTEVINCVHNAFNGDCCSARYQLCTISSARLDIVCNDNLNSEALFVCNNRLN